jgi:hypothetical protein
LNVFAPDGRMYDEKGNVVYPALPLATYFINAGLSEGDAIGAELGIRLELRDRVKKRAIKDDNGNAFRYLNDHNFRHQVNSELLGEILLEFGFSREELAKIELGTKIGLFDKEPSQTEALVTGIDGVTHRVTVEELPEHRADGSHLARVKDLDTGETKIV